MSFASLLVHDVTILTAATVTGRYGDAEKDWTTALETTAKGWVSQRSREEDHDQREAQVSDWVLFLHPDESITGLDRVVWEGITFEVEGTPDPAWSPRGLHHYEITLRVVDG